MYLIYDLPLIYLIVNLALRASLTSSLPVANTWIFLLFSSKDFTASSFLLISLLLFRQYIFIKTIYVQLLLIKFIMLKNKGFGIE